MPKRLLILSDANTAPSYSPRLISLIHYLTANGWSCTLEEGAPAPKGGIRRMLGKLFNTRERRYTRRIAATYKPADFDLVFCSTFYYFPLQAAAQLSRLWQKPLVVDVRDIAEQWGKTPYFTTPLPHIFGIEKLLARCYKQLNIRRRNKVLRQAAAVTTVSPWHRQFLQQLTSAPVSLIYNGFDERELMPLDKPTSLFRIAFIGRLINLRLRQPQMLFEAVGQLLAAQTIPADKLRLDFYCEPELTEALHQQAAQYGITDTLCLHTYIARSEIQNTITEASILLALGAPASEQQHGILGTKVFEAIGAEKPFMLIPSDEDNLAQLIQDTGIGIAARSTDDIKTFITKTYNAWLANGFTRQPVRDKQRFSRQSQAKQFETIFLQLCQ